MEGKHLREYEKAMGSLWGQGENLMDQEDIVQDRMAFLLENPDKLERYENKGHLEKSLKLFVRKRQIRPKQQRDNMVSMNDGEIELDGETGTLPVLVSLPKDYFLWKHLLNQFDSKGQRIWTTKQMRIMAKRYLSGKNQSEIAKEMDLNQSTVQRAYKAIDSKVLKLNLSDSVGRWYKGSGIRQADIWGDVYSKHPGNRGVDTLRLFDLEPRQPREYQQTGCFKPVKQVIVNRDESPSYPVSMRLASRVQPWVSHNQINRIK